MRTAFVIDPTEFSREGIVSWDLIARVDNATDKVLGTDMTSLLSQNSTTTIQVRYLPVAAHGWPAGRQRRLSIMRHYCQW